MPDYSFNGFFIHKILDNRWCILKFLSKMILNLHDGSIRNITLGKDVLDDLGSQGKFFRFTNYEVFQLCFFLCNKGVRFS